MLALDISNYNAFTPSIAQGLKDQDIGVIVRGGLPFERPGLVDISKRQLDICRDVGVRLDGIYGWAYFDSADPQDTIYQLVQLYGDYDPPSYWIDCEANNLPTPAQNEDWLDRYFAELDMLDQMGGVYTGRWWWVQWQNMNNSVLFKDRPLWAATDDKHPDLVFVAFGGWTRLAVEQYDLSGPDRDVIDDSFLPGLNGRKVVAQPTIDEQLSYLGGLTHDVIPACIKELEAAHGRTAPDQARIDRVLDALRKNAG